MTIREQVENLLSLDGPFTEAVEWVFGEAEQDEWRRALLAEQLRQTQYLAQIAANTGELPDIGDGVGDSGDEIIVQPPDQDEQKARRTPRYWVVEDTITVDNTNYQTESWGFVAKTVSLIFTDDIEVAFEQPGQDPNRELELAENKSPFTISGVDGLYAKNIWYRKSDNATSDPQLDIIAIK